MNVKERVATHGSKILSVFLIACSLVVLAEMLNKQVRSQGYQESLTGFDNQSNGMV